MYTETTEKFSEVAAQARNEYEKRPDWITFYRNVLGVEGIVRNRFTDTQELLAFEQSPEFEQIQQMLAKLRVDKEASPRPDDELEPTKVITVRMPKSIHESLRTEAHERKTSMNKLCISKLVQFIDDELVPRDT
ncbi:MAG: toxin-antitoxin system HicB family antitoxin [Planctomycetales bacterium]|nr:toxin-antitoxin system HicB family antitoxin [Planctomycetales bacterium]